MSTLYPYKGHFPLVDPNTFLSPPAPESSATSPWPRA